MFRIRSNEGQTATTPVNGVTEDTREILTSGNTGVLKSVFTSGGNGYEPVNVDRCEDFPRAPIAPRRIPPSPCNSDSYEFRGIAEFPVRYS